MPDLAGPIQALELASWLWLVPFFAAMGALANVLYASGFSARALRALHGELADEASPALPPFVAVSPATAARIAVASLGLSTVLAALHAVILLGLPPYERFLLDHVWPMVRVGQLDVGLDLSLDPLAALVTVLVTGAGTAVAWYAGKSGTGRWDLFAWIGVFVSALVLVVLADNVVLLLVGWVVLSLAGNALAATGTERALGAWARRMELALPRVGEVAVILGARVLFWGLGGSWTRDGAYQSDMDARISAVSVTTSDARPSADDPALRGGAATKGRGFLTVTGLPGALVYLDESRTPIINEGGAPLVTPFRRHELPGGSHSFRVAPDDRVQDVVHESKTTHVVLGGVLPNYTVPRTAFGADREVALTVLGPTLRFREVRDQLVLSDASGHHPFSEHLVAKRLWGKLGVVTAACLCFFLGACARSAELLPLLRVSRAASAPTWPTLGLCGAGMVLAAGCLVVRLSSLFRLVASLR